MVVDPNVSTIRRDQTIELKLPGRARWITKKTYTPKFVMFIECSVEGENVNGAILLVAFLLHLRCEMHSLGTRVDKNDDGPIRCLQNFDC